MKISIKIHEIKMNRKMKSQPGRFRPDFFFRALILGSKFYQVLPIGLLKKNR